MRIVILGSGVIGVTTAWYLSLAGHQVTVIDRQPDVAMETSANNAGQISPGYSTPWAAPGIPLKALKWMFQRHAPLAFRPDGTLFQLRWMYQMLLNCDMSHYTVNKARMLRLAEYSRDCMKTLRAETGIEYEGRQQGTIQLFRTAAQFESAAKDIAVLEEANVPYQLLEAEQLSWFEPALETVKHKLSGGLRLPNDETGDCHLFTQHLAKMAIDSGVIFQHSRHIQHIAVEGNAVSAIIVDGEKIVADAYVVALGAYSTSMLAELVSIPVYPLKGYSLTIPVVDSQASPISTVLDETYKIAITRFEKRIRVGGMAEIVGFDTRLPLSRKETLEMVVNDLFPHGGDICQASFWSGLRPMTPDGTPIVGRTGFNNLYLNTGHGTLGWTMACGSGQLLSDLISGKTPEIPFEDLSVERYMSSHHSELSLSPG